MALTDFQRTVCRLLAAHRVASGESYVAGGVALNEWLGAPRLSRELIALLPAEEAGKCVLTAKGELFRLASAEVGEALERESLNFHAGSIRGAFPSLLSPQDFTDPGI
jgi:hypothetical protein